MGRILSQTTLEKLKNAKVKNFWKLLLNLKTNNCECVTLSLVQGIIADIGGEEYRLSIRRNYR